MTYENSNTFIDKNEKSIKGSVKEEDYLISAKQMENFRLRIQIVLDGGSRGTYGFTGMEIKNILDCYEYLQSKLKQKDELLEEIKNKLENRIDLLNHDYFKTTNPYERDCISFEIENLEDMLLNLFPKVEKDVE